MSDDRLVSELEDKHADMHRYSARDEFHRPTFLEAARCVILLRNEILRRMRK